MRGRGTTTEQGYGHYWRKVRARILVRDRWRCRYCGGRAGEVDHVVPIDAGGARYDERNLVAACKRCNVRRAREREQQLGYPNRPAWSKPPRGPSSEPRRVWPGAITLE